MSSIKFSTRKVRKALFQLNTSKSSGPDGILAIVLKSCAPELVPVLYKLFQLSYNLGIFPSSFAAFITHVIQLSMDRFIPSSYKTGNNCLQSGSLHNVQKLSNIKTTTLNNGNYTKLHIQELHLYKLVT